MSKEIAILGAGPAGMMAAHAVSQAGFQPVIYDRNPDKTRRNAGVFILHDDCGLALKSIEVDQRILGAEIYRREANKLFLTCKAYNSKVYPKEKPKPTSVSIMDAMKHPRLSVFNVAEALDHLWNMYGKYVKPLEISGFADVFSLGSVYKRVVSTIPMPILFPDIEYFSTDAFVYVSEAPPEDSFIYYNVGSAINWYRCSAVYGVFTAEYANEQAALQDGHTIDKLKKVQKVIDCDRKDQLPEIPWLTLTGRYGAWDKTCLTHHVYADILTEAITVWS